MQKPIKDQILQALEEQASGLAIDPEMEKLIQDAAATWDCIQSQRRQETMLAKARIYATEFDDLINKMVEIPDVVLIPLSQEFPQAVKAIMAARAQIKARTARAILKLPPRFHRAPRPIPWSQDDSAEFSESVGDRVVKQLLDVARIYKVSHYRRLTEAELVTMNEYIIKVGMAPFEGAPMSIWEISPPVRTYADHGNPTQGIAPKS